MDAVQAMFTVRDITEHRNNHKRDSAFKGNQKTIKLLAISPGYHSLPDEWREIARQMWDATPSGEISLGVLNPSAAGFFEVDGIYEVTFRKIGNLS